MPDDLLVAGGIGPGVTVAEPQPTPEFLLSIPDLALRQRAEEAWRCASRLFRLIDQWRAWLLQLNATEDADSGLALLIAEAVQDCIRALLRLGVDLPTFRKFSEAELLGRFPQLPSPYRNKKNEYKYYRYSMGLLRSLYPFQGELFVYLGLLKASPSAAFVNSIIAQAKDPEAPSEAIWRTATETVKLAETHYKRRITTSSISKAKAKGIITTRNHLGEGRNKIDVMIDSKFDTWIKTMPPLEDGPKIGRPGNPGV